jgi:iron complex outermembrane receptor protein
MKRNRFYTCGRDNVLAFKKWANKSYSLFSTIRKVVVISVLAVAYFVSVPLTTAAVSQQDSSEVKMQFDIDEIEVTASRAPAVFSEIVRVLTVIESNEIEQAPAQSVQELLEYMAAVDVRQRGAEGVQADIGIRGGSFDQTIILLNGLNITDPQTGHHNLNIPVSLSQIERIEVLEGPAARVYGPSAFSGAVNIITRQPGNSEIKLKADAGSHRFFNAALSGSFQTGTWNHLIAANRKSSDGYIENTDFKISNLFYSTQIENEEGILSFQAGASEKAFGANSYYTPKYPNQFEETGTFFTSVRWEQNSVMHFSPAVYWRRHSDKFMLFRENPPSWYASHNYHLTNVYGGNLNSWFTWAAGKTAFGAEIRSENILSNVLGEVMADKTKVPGEDAFYTKSKSRSIVSFFVDHSIYLKRFTASAGLMANYISDRQNDIAVFPGIDAGYSVLPSLKLVGSFNTSMRMPTFTDLYYSGPTNIGNPDLKPEKSMTLEGGLKLNRNFVRGHFILFYRSGKDMIDWVKQDSDELWQAKNLTQIKSAGAEVRVQLLPSKKWGSGWPENVSLNYFYNNQQKETSGFISNYVLDNLKHKFTSSVTQKITDNLFVNFRGTYQDRDGTFTRFENNQPAAETEYNPFWLFHGKVTYRSPGLEFNASVSNIFNRQYFDLGNIPQPGRWFKAGVVYPIKFQ